MASSSKATSRRSKAETKESKSTIKAKGTTKAKAKVAVAAEGEDVEMHDGDKESDPPEEDNDSGEEELEDVEERKAASKRCVFKVLYFRCSFLLSTFQLMLYAELSFIVRKLPWIGEMRWTWKVGKSAIRMSSR